MADFVTLSRHILLSERSHLGASGDFTLLLSHIATATKVVARHVKRAGLSDVLGKTGDTNVQGEEVAKLDVIANDMLISMLDDLPMVCALASEEEDEFRYTRAGRLSGRYLVCFDPLDGSTNIDVNVSIGTIFGIYPRRGPTPVTEADFLRPGNEQVAAGYIVYGSSTVLVYTDGESVDSFTLDPSSGEFFLTRTDLQVKAESSYLSINECNSPYWPGWVPQFINRLKGRNDNEKRRISGRHIGSFVVDFHRNLIKGGIYIYPVDRRTKRGKLRLLYECSPLAFIAEVAGGAASHGRGRLLDLVPEALHQRCGVIIGTPEDVALAEQLIANAPGGEDS